jgi:gamma-glutamyltranspeptidase/glutathione hydrolase
MVVTSSPEASAAGARILELGGNAVDAAVATAFALGAAEPGSSGLGGGTVILLRLADGSTAAIDGLATVPVGIDRPRMQRAREAGTPFGHMAAATPVTLAALADALERYGTMSLAEVLAPAIELAEFGHGITPSHRAFLETYVATIRQSGYLSGMLLRDGWDLWEVGHRYCQEDLGRTMRRLATEGTGAFYAGEIAAAIQADMLRAGGFVRRSDLARVEPTERQAIHGRYRGLEVVTFPSPGGAALVEALHILEAFPPDLLRRDSVDRLHLLVEAARIALVDAAASDLPIEVRARRLLDPGVAAQRAALIRFDRALSDGEIGPYLVTPWEEKDTTHLSVIDRLGNVAVFTQSLGRTFGSHVATPGLGFPYNNFLEAFEYIDPRSPDYIRPRRTAYTTLAPTLVLRDGTPILALGSAGTLRLVPSILITISNVVDRGMSLRQAMAFPRVLWGGSKDNTVYLEVAPPVTDAQADELVRRGFAKVYRLRFPPRDIDVSAFGGVNAIAVDHEGTFVGVADPRRQGCAAGATLVNQRRSSRRP